MKTLYNPPLVEKWVSDTFIKAGILCPADICAEKLCAAFGIEYGDHFGVSGSAIITGVPYIAVDCRLSTPKRHEQFLHELDTFSGTMEINVTCPSPFVNTRSGMLIYLPCMLLYPST